MTQRSQSSRHLRGLLVLVLLATATVVLGIWGVSRLPEGGLSMSDKVYSAIELFNANLEAASAKPPWQLEVARFLAPVVVAYALLLAVFTFARDQAQRLRTRLFARDHVVIVGAGRRGSALARSIRSARRVVVVDWEAAGGAARSLRETGVAVLAGDARDPEVLHAARAERAAHVVVLTGDDSSNLEVLAALRGVIRPERPVPVHVAIDAPAVWSGLHRWPIQSDRVQRRVEFVSLPDRVAQLLIDSAAADANIPRERQKLVIRGEGPSVARLAVHILRSPVAGDSVEIALEGDDAAENLQLLETTDAWVFDRATVRAGVPEDAGAASAAFVCGLGEAEALDAAMMLIGRLDEGGTVHVAVPDDDIEEALTGAGIELRGLALVPTEGLLLGEDLLEGSAFERIARGRHAQYLVLQRERGDSPENREALRPWSELDEKYRQSNRRFADGVCEVLARLDAELVPLRGREVGDLPIPPEVMEELAEAEHERWMRDQTADGWRPTEGDRDPERKLHPMLCPWEELPESEREKDREAIRSLPTLFAAIGYELVIPSEPEPAGSW